MKNKFLQFILITTLISCGKPVAIKTIPLSEANKNIIEVAKKDFNLDIKLKAFENTVWIYLPIKDPILEVKADPKGPSSEKNPTEKQKIYYLDVNFNEDNFIIDYDIALSKEYGKSYGYSSSFGEEYRNIQRNIMTCVNRAYSNIEKIESTGKYYKKVDGDRELTDKQENDQHKKFVHAHTNTAEVDVPLFFVIVISDIKTGISATTLFYFEDLRRAHNDPSFYEEYAKRIISKYPEGNQNVINDTEGRHINYHGINWEEFLDEQIEFRINFKYTRSSFTPSADAKKEILTIVNDAVSAYEFKDFNNVTLNDVNKKESDLVSKQELSKYLPDAKETKPTGKLHIIKFNYDKDSEHLVE